MQGTQNPDKQPIDDSERASSPFQISKYSLLLHHLHVSYFVYCLAKMELIKMVKAY